MSLYHKFVRFICHGALALAIAAPAAAQQTESRMVGRISDANGRPGQPSAMHTRFNTVVTPV